MPKNNSLNKILVIGSGPIIIGQAAEFDYAGTQACKALKEEGFEVILVNSNPATIMTDDNIADRVYIQPLTVNALSYIIEKEKPLDDLRLPLQTDPICAWLAPVAVAASYELSNILPSLHNILRPFI